MRTLLIFLFIANSFLAHSQEIIITLKEGKKIKSIVSAHSDHTLYTKNGTFEYSKIDAIEFLSNEKRYLSKQDDIYHDLNFSKDQNYKRHLNLTEHEKSLIINADTLKKGIYLSFNEFKYNNPSLPFDYDISSTEKKYEEAFSGHKELTFYKIFINKTKSKSIGKIFGFCDGNNIYLHPQYEKYGSADKGFAKFDLNTLFSKIEYLGRYCFFENIATTRFTSPNSNFATTVTTSTEKVYKVMDAIYGSVQILDKDSLRNLIADDPELLNDFNEEKNKSKLLKEYFFKYMEKHETD